MATHFSANQYENAFRPQKLGNWQVSSSHQERPRSKRGATAIIANDCGHLISDVSRSSKNPWGDFVGTWDYPRHVPGNSARVTTARTQHSQQRLKEEAEEAHRVLSGSVKNINRTTLRNMSGDKPPLNNNKPVGVDPVLDSASPVVISKDSNRSPSPPEKPTKCATPDAQ